MSIHPKRGKLTPELIASVPPKGIRGDGGRLFIHRLSLGRFRWDFATYAPGKSLRLAPIGFYPAISIEEARRIAARLRYEDEIRKIDLFEASSKTVVTTVDEAFDWLRREFPLAFNEPRPLAHGIRHELAKHAEKHGVDHELMTTAVSRHVNSDAYLDACTENASRFDLQGNRAGLVALAEHHWACLAKKGKTYKYTGF